MKQYRLLKDYLTWIQDDWGIPIRAGTIFYKEGYIYKEREFGITIPASAVENNPKWFEEIKRNIT